ncbi:MAG: glycosyltransferase family 2 protein [Rhodobiaceae bacterium]|nr:glycosyltransferase family 2 protein [Rhodobiaceae bacterium]MCC0041501.1 glycosyltransferase family 2 protein [Rhodobiaceae bacterium]
MTAHPRVSEFAGMLISVVISTYNRPDALTAVLNGMRRQTDRNFEILIADDGSDEATGETIHRLQGRIGVPMRRIWHPDRGYRLAAIRNRALAAARGDYLVFLDGDCVPRPGFVAAHRRLAEPGRYVFGNRILLSREFTHKVLQDRIDLSALNALSFAAGRMKGSINRLAPLLSLPLGAWRKRPGHDWKRLRGCNFAVWRDDLMKIDGFDTAYVGWGLEDSDLAVRLANIGVRPKDGRFATGVLHLWHPEAKRDTMGGNLTQLQKTIDSRATRATRGLSTMSRLQGPQTPPNARQE